MLKRAFSQFVSKLSMQEASLIILLFQIGKQREVERKGLLKLATAAELETKLQFT